MQLHLSYNTYCCMSQVDLQLIDIHLRSYSHFVGCGTAFRLKTLVVACLEVDLQLIDIPPHSCNHVVAHEVTVGLQHL